MYQKDPCQPPFGFKKGISVSNGTNMFKKEKLADQGSNHRQDSYPLFKNLAYLVIWVDCILYPWHVLQVTHPFMPCLPLSFPKFELAQRDGFFPIS